MSESPFDTQRFLGFADRLRGVATEALTHLLLRLGVESGLFAAMAAGGARSASEWAALAKLDPAHVEDALLAMGHAGLVDFDPVAETFALGPERSAALIDRSGPYFLGGILELVQGITEAMPAIQRSFRTGQGVSPEVYGDSIVSAFEALSAPFFRFHLVQEWLPAMPGVPESLVRGGRVLDFGCGAGLSTWTMARAFPSSRFLGVDLDPRAIERASALAVSGGLSNLGFRVGSVEVLEAEGPFDLVTLFSVLHNLPDPGAFLSALHGRVTQGGSVFVLLPATSATGVAGPVTADRRVFFHAASTLYATPVALSRGRLGPSVLQSADALASMAVAAGFRNVRRLPIPNAANAFFQLER